MADQLLMDGWFVFPPLSSIPKLDELPWCESIREQPLPGPEGWPDSTPGEEGSHHRGEGEGQCGYLPGCKLHCTLKKLL